MALMSCMGLSFDLVSPDFESLRRALPALCPIVDRGARCGVEGYVGFSGSWPMERWKARCWVWKSIQLNFSLLQWFGQLS
jgi:hypothetical protein